MKQQQPHITASSITTIFVIVFHLPGARRNYENFFSDMQSSNTTIPTIPIENNKIPINTSSTIVNPNTPKAYNVVTKTIIPAKNIIKPK